MAYLASIFSSYTFRYSGLELKLVVLHGEKLIFFWGNESKLALTETV